MEKGFCIYLRRLQVGQCGWPTRRVPRYHVSGSGVLILVFGVSNVRGEVFNREVGLKVGMGFFTFGFLGIFSIP